MSPKDTTRYKEVLISEEEYKEWCKPWKGSLIVNVLRKRVGFKVMENKLNRDWAKSGPIKIIDMP